ncbi:MAG: PEP/pyruvate-binding domain-containing protein [Chloroflexota bacterium]
MMQTLISPINLNQIPGHSGGKAEQIQQLMTRGVPVPQTFVCVWDAYENQQQDKTAVLVQLRQELIQIIDPQKAYAIRSSANVEDGLNFSFAGQFISLLNVQGVDNVLDAVQQVWDSMETVNLDVYVDLANFSKDHLRMAVIIQEMVNPIVSGVSFSKNPITGLDEIVVEAVCGSGVSLVQEGSTPDRWVFKWGDWVEQPEQTSIDEDVIAEVVAQTAKMAKLYGFPLDLEWVYDGTAVYWVQMREITTGGDLSIYSNRISREVLPGLIKPLIWSVNTWMVNSAWIKIFTELIGPNTIKPQDLSKAFYYQAYFSMGTIGRIFAALGMPQETLEVMLGLEGGDQRPKFRPSAKILRHVPRMLTFAIDKLRYSRKLDVFLPEMDQTFKSFGNKSLDEMAEQELLAEIDALCRFTQRAAYANIVGPLLMQLYNGLLRANLQKQGVDYDQFNLSYHLDNIEEYDPNPNLDALYAQYVLLDEPVLAQIEAGNYADFQRMAGIKDLQTAVSAFIDQFGHLSDSGNDFSKRPWREDPDLVLKMIINRRHVDHDSLMENYKREGTDKESYHWDTLPISRVTRWRLGWQYQRARQFRYYREAVSFKYTYGYGLLRNYFLALADHLVQRQIIRQPDDIFYLYKSEIEAIVNENSQIDYQALIEKRKQEIQDAQNIVLPEIIYGDQPPPLETYDKDQKRLSGIPTSGGYFQGPVRVIQTISDFDKMAPGAVLVVPFSDVSWTPLFARAGAIIAESGGILSHSSIVAREYKVPAVVSVTGACRILKDDMHVIVDGFKGEIFLNHQ